MLTLAVIATTLTAALASSEIPPAAPGVLWSALALADARRLVQATDGRVESVEPTSEGGFLLTARFDDGLRLRWSGMQCEGAGEALACTEYKLSYVFQAVDAATAASLEHALSSNFMSDYADGDAVEVWRMGFTYGGVTPEHLRQTLLTTYQIAREAWAEVMPPPP